MNTLRNHEIFQNDVSDSFIKTTSRYMDDAITTIFRAADIEVDQTLQIIDKQLQLNPDLHLENWSFRVSRDGIELVSDPAAIWMKGKDWDALGFIHDFLPNDRLAWLRALIKSYRESLSRMLVRCVMLDAGYEQIYKSGAFIDAVNRVPKTKGQLNLDPLDCFTNLPDGF